MQRCSGKNQVERTQQDVFIEITNVAFHSIKTYKSKGRQGENWERTNHDKCPRLDSNRTLQLNSVHSFYSAEPKRRFGLVVSHKGEKTDRHRKETQEEVSHKV